MAQRGSLPNSASVAHTLDDGRLHAPSAARNAPIIARLMASHAPGTGRALEIASGTGQSVVEFATALPGLIWQPTEIDQTRRASINAWAAQAGLSNLREALNLDATAPGWGAQHPGQDLIVLVNLTHLISAAKTQVLLNEAAIALAPGGRFFLYGPFLREGCATSDGGRNFHSSLQAQDPAIGYKDTADIKAWLLSAGLRTLALTEMPANNLTFICERQPETA